MCTNANGGNDVPGPIGLTSGGCDRRCWELSISQTSHWNSPCLLVCYSTKSQELKLTSNSWGCLIVIDSVVAINVGVQAVWIGDEIRSARRFNIFILCNINLLTTGNSYRCKQIVKHSKSPLHHKSQKWWELSAFPQNPNSSLTRKSLTGREEILDQE